MALCDDPTRLFIPGEYCIKHATAAWEKAGHFRLRREVFCHEQRIFAGDDIDEADAAATPIVALACMLGDPDHVVGTVRIHEVEAGHWQGSRLAVQPGFRRLGGLGMELIRAAVGTAKAYGAQLFLAHVQAQNVPMFERMHWSSLTEINLYGRLHHLMRVDLGRYPAVPVPRTRLLVPARQAA